jgi:SAM-dependent methyltransferase
MPISIEKAKLYEKYRLPYASQGVRDLLDHIGSVEVIADIGAGTGRLARLFAEHGSQLYAVEPDPAMRQVAATELAEWDNIELRDGSAEQTTLAERSIDLIAIGNAFHRFKPKACAELRRILKPTGWIVLFTYTRSNRALEDLLFPKLAVLKGMMKEVKQAWHGMPEQELFGNCDVHRRSYQQSRADDWTIFFGSECSGIEAPEPGDPEFGQFETISREVFNAFAVDGVVQVEYETHIAFGQPQAQ